MKPGTLVRLVARDNSLPVLGYGFEETIKPFDPGNPPVRYIKGALFNSGTMGMVLGRFERWDENGEHYKVLVDTKVFIFKVEYLEGAK